MAGSGVPRRLLQTEQNRSPSQPARRTISVADPAAPPYSKSTHLMNAAHRGSIGSRVRRVEDEKLITGRGRFAGDVHLEGQTYLAVRRSHEPHALIRSIDVVGATAIPGVIAVFTQDDLPEAARFVHDDFLPPELAGPALEWISWSLRLIASHCAWTARIDARPFASLRELAPHSSEASQLISPPERAGVTRSRSSTTPTLPMKKLRWRPSRSMISSGR